MPTTSVRRLANVGVRHRLLSLRRDQGFGTWGRTECVEPEKLDEARDRAQETDAALDEMLSALERQP
jgi:hypothetical protein